MRIIPTKFFLFLLICGVFVSCQKENHIDNILNNAQELMEIHPDSALNILNSIQNSTLKEEKAQARYALLKSMALDKNYIDTIEFDVLQPAIDYYLKKGDANDRLRTLYYQGRIYSNRKEDEEALRCFVNATKQKGLISDSLTLARAFTAKGNILYIQNQFISSARANLQGAEIYKKMNRSDLYTDNLVRALKSYINATDKPQADSIMDLLANPTLNWSAYGAEHTFLHCRIVYAIKFLDSREIKDRLNSIDRKKIDDDLMLEMAWGYVKAGDKDNARECFEKVSPNYNRDALKLLTIKSGVLELNDDLAGALNALRKGITISDSIVGSWTADDRLFVEKKYEWEHKATEEKDSKNESLFNMLFVIVILLIILAYYSYRIVVIKSKAYTLGKENKSYRLDLYVSTNKNRDLEEQLNKEDNQLRLLKAEINEKSKVLEKKNENNTQIKQALRYTLSIVMGLISARITSNIKYKSEYLRIVEQVEAENPTSFLSEMYVLLSKAYPLFMNKLKDAGLTEIEINFVVLFAMGLSAKEIGAYLNIKSYYNFSSAIRTKLKLEEDTSNLGQYIISEMKKEE